MRKICVVSLSPPKPTSIACISAPFSSGRPRPGVATKKSATRGGPPSGRDEGEPAGARPGQRALGDPAGEAGRDAGVDGVAALLEDARSGPRGERVTGCDRALHETALPVDEGEPCIAL